MSLLALSPVSHSHAFTGDDQLLLFPPSPRGALHAATPLSPQSPFSAFGRLFAAPPSSAFAAYPSQL
jgi:hypothetical protein